MDEPKHLEVGSVHKWGCAMSNYNINLSTAHKRTPIVEWRKGASILKVSKADKTEHRGGGKRGVVKGFSRASRRRLMNIIASVRRDAKLPLFITLTYPNNYPEPKESKKHLKEFLRRMKRMYPSAGAIWKLEPQQRGAPHYHILVWGIKLEELIAWVPDTWYKIAGGGDENHLLWHLGLLGNQHCVNPVRSYKGVWSYASKYLGKTFEVAGWDNKEVGRYWGVVGAKNIPFGQAVYVMLCIAEAITIMRYQRRFAHMKSRSYPSLTIFCDADQWAERLIIGLDKRLITT